MKCLTEGRLVELSQVMMLADAEELVHLDSCGSCKRLLAEMLEDSALLGELVRPTLPSASGGLRFGVYDECEEIACGSMSRVYRGRAPDGHFVAIKVCRDQSLLPSFANEAKMLGRCAAEDVGGVISMIAAELDHLPAFIVTPYFAGGTLSQRLQQGALQPQEVLSFCRALAQTLVSLERLGIVHGDLKASNILLDMRNLPVLADLGGARHSAAPGQNSTFSLTDSGHMSLVSMSPEQARGEPLTAASDIFSFGIVTYQLASGRHPFLGGTSWQIAARILHEEAPDPEPHLPAPLKTRLAPILRACLDKDPEKRPRARDLYASLVQEEAPLTAALPKRRAQTSSKPGVRLPALVFAALALLAGGLLVKRGSSGTEAAGVLAIRLDDDGTYRVDGLARSLKDLEERIITGRCDTVIVSVDSNRPYSQAQALVTMLKRYPIKKLGYRRGNIVVDISQDRVGLTTKSDAARAGGRSQGTGSLGP
ncbi:MAG: hypothetical protein RL095_3174 [Verrucomicrobiota bacterium]|jgi:serine/threonine protein kinase